MAMSGKTLLTICLMISGCAHKIKIKHHENTAYAWSHKFQKCLEMPFIISKDLVGKSGPSKVVPIEMCDNITGFKNSDPEEQGLFKTIIEVLANGGWPAFKVWLEIEIFQNAEDHGLMDKDWHDRPYMSFDFQKGLND